MDRRAVRLALGLTIAGALMLAAGVATWLIITVGRVASGMAARDLRLASLALLAGGVALAGPRSLMNPPLPDPPRLGPSSRDARPADRVWWRAARSPAGGWDDSSEEWLRSLRGPAIQQPPPHSAE